MATRVAAAAAASGAAAAAPPLCTWIAKVRSPASASSLRLQPLVQHRLKPQQQQQYKRIHKRCLTTTAERGTENGAAVQHEPTQGQEQQAASTMQREAWEPHRPLEADQGAQREHRTFLCDAEEEHLTPQQKEEKEQLVKMLAKKLAGPLADEEGRVPTGDQRPIAIEVDGPSHFYSNSCRYTAYTKLKHRLLTRMGYKVLHVPYFEWRKLRGQREREEYMRKKLQEEPTEWLDPEDEAFYNQRMGLLQQQYQQEVQRMAQQQPQLVPPRNQPAPPLGQQQQHSQPLPQQPWAQQRHDSGRSNTSVQQAPQHQHHGASRTAQVATQQWASPPPPQQPHQQASAAQTPHAQAAQQPQPLPQRSRSMEAGQPQYGATQHQHKQPPLQQEPPEAAQDIPSSATDPC